MDTKEKLDIDIFKVVTGAIAESSNLENMVNSLIQLLVGALGIKGCTIFLLDLELGELEPISSFGLSSNYLNKGPLLVKKSIDQKMRGEPIVISNVSQTDRLQYPQDAKKEGIQAIVSLSINLHGRLIGVLRLYHYETWKVSHSDLDSMTMLADIISLALMYTRLVNTLQSVKAVLGEVHPVWLEER
jgi:transcriptional regulator with GAF, ATPase, and Fis domain